MQFHALKTNYIEWLGNKIFQPYVKTKEKLKIKYNK